MLPIVSSAWINPVTLLATKPKLAPFEGEASPVGSVAAPGDLASRCQQLGRVESDVVVEGGAAADLAQHRPQAIDQRKLTPSCCECSRSTLMITASISTWTGRVSTRLMIWSMIFRFDS